MMATRSATPVIAVVGLGADGLRFVGAALEEGVSVIGLDADMAKVGALRAARYGDDAAGEVRFTRDPSVLPSADVIVIACEDASDLWLVRDVLAQAGRSEDPGRIVVLDAKPYPGRAEHLLRPILERAGLRLGEDVDLAFAPSTPAERPL